MDIQSYGKDLLDTLAQRSLDAIRSARLPDMRDVLSGRAFRAERSVSVGAAIGVLLAGVALGAGVTALVTPTSGPDLRKRMARSTKNAGVALGSVTTRMQGGVKRARRALEQGMERTVESVSAASPTVRATATRAPAKRSSKGRAKSPAPMNGASKRAARAVHA